ncbi:hypothetical protein [Chryseobacterium sp. G0201]|uniref:hypothetical protein n=1 Tax=Chryseobacterium sp. G0201 TaxID=2487065 RepID=UPI000F4DD0BB|nr:hypothetical protein [Chryseobacterium sp. G0201]AZA53427.1 hypothetical protein EG348_10600 [Chryseobacterium sp. G0201]
MKKIIFLVIVLLISISCNKNLETSNKVNLDTISVKNSTTNEIKTIKENNCDDGDEVSNSIDYSVNGRWKMSCGEGVGSLTVQNKNASLVVLSNQIYIEMTETKRYDFEKGIAYKLKQIPEDLGTYGIKLDWKQYLNDKPIAYIKVIDDNTINFIGMASIIIKLIKEKWRNVNLIKKAVIKI